MTKEEKILSGVKCCVRVDCRSCPYAKAGDTCTDELLADLSDALMTTGEERE